MTEPLSRVVQLRLSDRSYQALHLEAQENGVRHTDVLRAAILSYLGRHQADMVDPEEVEAALEAAGWSLSDEA